MTYCTSPLVRKPQLTYIPIRKPGIKSILQPLPLLLDLFLSRHLCSIKVDEHQPTGSNGRGSCVVIVTDVAGVDVAVDYA